MSQETGQETFLKAQIAVSEAHGRQRLNTAVQFCSSVACTKRKRRAAIFETGERLIFFIAQKRSLSEDSILFPPQTIVSLFRGFFFFKLKTCVNNFFA